MKKFGFGDSFINWIKILLNDYQSYVINGAFATRYAKVIQYQVKYTQDDSISAFFFIITLEFIFALIKNKVTRSFIFIYRVRR